MSKVDGSFHANVNLKKLSSLIATIEAKLIGPHGGLQVSKKAIPDEQAPWNDPVLYYNLISLILALF